MGYLNRLSEKEGLTACYSGSDDVTWDRSCTGYRLPTEAEWEYAARAGTATPWSFGDDDGVAGDFAWYRDNAAGKVHAVGEKQPNPWRLSDMHGNVWEWVWALYGDTYVHKGGPAEWQYHLARGGSYFATPDILRSAFRNENRLTGLLGDVGFRCARRTPQH